MPLDESDASCLWDILRHAQLVSRFVEGLTEATYMNDERTRFAIERLMEIIGEAAKQLSEPTRQLAPEIPWPKIIGQRHMLAHDYGRIDLLRLCSVATERIPELIQAVERLLSQVPSSQT